METHKVQSLGVLENNRKGCGGVAIDTTCRQEKDCREESKGGREAKFV